MKNVLVENLLSHGFSEGSTAWGTKTFVKTLTKTVEVAWVGEVESVLSIRVGFNPEMSICFVDFCHGGREPFKSRTYDTVGKRTWNAIAATAKNNGFEL